MPLPKGKLLALVAVFAAIGIAAGTGAFTTVSAERTAEVNVAGDSSALLQITEASGPNSQYIENTGSTTTFNFSESDEGAAGLNTEAETDYRNVFVITNQGSQEVAVAIQPQDTSNTDYSRHVAFYTTEGASNLTDAKAFTGGSSLGVATSQKMIDISGEAKNSQDPANITTTSTSSLDNYAELAPGESMKVSVFVDLSAGTVSSSDDVLTEVTIVADAQAADGTDETNYPE